MDKGSGSESGLSRIRIRVTQKERIQPDLDPDPQHCFKLYTEHEHSTDTFCFLLLKPAIGGCFLALLEGKQLQNIVYNSLKTGKP